MAITYDIKKDVHYRQGKEEGRVEGKEEEKKTVRICPQYEKSKMSLEQIAEFTGLSLARIQKL